jgi:hypothetical protein
MEHIIHQAKFDFAQSIAMDQPVNCLSINFQKGQHANKKFRVDGRRIVFGPYPIEGCKNHILHDSMFECFFDLTSGSIVVQDL